MALEDAELFLSGGASNADPALSLGGVESSVKLGLGSGSFNPSGPGGVTIAAAGAPITGAGRLLISNTHLAPDVYVEYEEPGFTSGGVIFLQAADGSNDRFIVQAKGDESQFLILDIDTASIPASTHAYYDVDVVGASPILLPNVTELQSINGVTQYRCLYLRNTSGIAKTADVWLGIKDEGPELLELGTTTTVSGGVESTIANEFTEPAGISNWSYYDDPTNTLTLTLNTGESIGIWLKRVINPFNIANKNLSSFSVLAELS